MIASLLLLTLPFAFANPLPTSSAATSIAPAPTPPPVVRGFSASLSHGQGAIARTKAYENVKAKRGFFSRDVENDDSSLPPSWLLWAGARVDSKYNEGKGGFAAAYALALSKRAQNGEITLTDHNLDTSYSASLSVGTPAQTLDIVLDTGSSDLWLASTECDTTACESMDRYNPSDSSSSINLTTSFSIEYGSGSTSGSLFQDLITLGGYSVASQTFASCDEVSSGLLSSGVSGIMGLSWQALAYSKATPWWITLAKSSAWSDPLFAFYLARYRNVAGATATESNGGTASFGYLDSSLYSGDVTYVNVDDNAQYWQIKMASVTVQGTSVSLGSSNMAAIDTGTTLIGGPESVVAAVYAKISGSQRMSGSYSSYYEYPCNTTVDFEITFGGYTIKITDQDFNLGRYSSDKSMCTGAVYIQTLSSSSPVQWIVGDAALKNTYTVFRYSPAAVGFADLASSVASSEAAQSTTIVDASSLLAAGSSTSSTSVSTTTSSSSSVASTSTSSAKTAQTTSTDSVSSEAPHVVTVSGSSTIGVAPTASGSEATASASGSDASSGALSALGGGSKWLTICVSMAVSVFML
ncbi:hypothetical protein I308_100785 [Cryptococcus tetragattii IND107]|uniref:Peptidase A1 domain-containing protein n=1 Tax=Cryptococcus tetragattii IND107 TaxID=1296105 RepID=A0ABR3C5S5_9TREE|nr:endopeptidase [Cryptococcus tetragattii IND107]